MKIQELIDELTKITGTEPEKDVVIEVFDIKKGVVTVGYIFEPVIHNAKEDVKIRPIRLRGHNVYLENTKDLEEIEDELCPRDVVPKGDFVKE